MTLSFECFNNNKKLVIVDFILCLYQNHFLRKKDYYILLAQINFSDYFIKAYFKSQLI